MNNPNIHFNLKRRFTKEVSISNLKIGYEHDIMVQSMTNTNPSDIKQTVNQIVELYHAGAQLIRLAVPRLKDVETIIQITDEIDKLGLKIPLAADVHYNPDIAEKSALVFDKVRINPGNYAEDKIHRKNYSDDEYDLSLQKSKSNIKKLINLCKPANKAIRIGINHGSLSDRILNKYGNTIEGMVVSAMEYLKICQELDFHNIVLSIKSSNPKTMVAANRKLVAAMDAEKMNYPIHLGVTEAGDMEDGRIKSAIGIGTLLLDGIGDTIRVSLTENPINEIPVANQIIEVVNKSYINHSFSHEELLELSKYLFIKSVDKFKIGGQNIPVVISEEHNLSTNKEFCPDLIVSKEECSNIRVDPSKESNFLKFDLLNLNDFKDQNPRNSFFYYVDSNMIIQNSQISKEILFDHPIILRGQNSFQFKLAIAILRKDGHLNPIILNFKPSDNHSNHQIVEASIATGTLLLEGLAEGIWLEDLNSEISFKILQSSKRRISQTEFVICPSCGRTKFEIEKISAEIKAKTSHLKGLTIAVMGCFVNGPGEIGESDYGYIGAGKNLVNLYRKKQLIKKNIPQENALAELIEIIKSDGFWKEPG